MKVLILGGNGMLGPWTIKALEGRHDLRVTDINDPSAGLQARLRQAGRRRTSTAWSTQPPAWTSSSTCRCCARTANWRSTSARAATTT